jgi:hypothetical protein
MRKLMFGAVAAAALGAAVTTAQAAPAAASVDGFTASVPAEYSQYRRYGRPYYRRGYARGYGYGGGAAAGIAGLAAGALIAGAIANSAQAAPPPPATVDGRLADWCARRYRTFDPVTGTFMAQSGERLVCTYP